MAVERVQANGIEIAFEAVGDPADPPLVLIHGISRQLIDWRDEFLAALAGRGLRVVRFDNRDAGESTHLDDSGPGYTLSDMAADTAGLIDALGHDSAHVVGVSMGGMIAQTLAIEHPDRVRSLTSVMSTTGDSEVGQATPEAQAVLLAPPPRDRDEAVALRLRSQRVIGSPGFDRDEDWIAENAVRAYERAFDPAGVRRQFAAIIASGNRTDRLRGLRVPTLVLHGEDDPLIGVSGGRATAAAIPGAELVTIAGMGHDLPRGAWERIIDPIAALVERVERERVPA
ncbi:MAG TPA: alpha/beta hydrolase [Thermoleophilaceae bacterium]|nr:alpha/beta hydrolase [Thermoleophilaceae bacterium]